ncbi:hypothetical protein [Fonticella tunisiensis]|uniref:Uncharacterized protein n=1 Tax=Fonticella tunisiensis TaxID=1096341 RepID=A0A4R7KAF1_9CLOT|nr:hypothetical protein [Fonticella tunisiensis]TDT51336.1 hypothetical protein EDD71_11820 [Fonticella tunisiensis]
MKTNDFLQKIYEINPETGNYIIEISLDTYSDIFNDWDHSTIMKRDLNPDLSEFLNGCSADIPLRYGVDIVFYISNQARNREVEEKITQKLKNYYSFYLRSHKRLLKDYYKRTVVYAGASFSFLAASIFLENILPESIFFETLLEGLDIGGWVFLWEAISFFFFRRKKILNTIRGYERFVNSSVYFRYEGKVR